MRVTPSREMLDYLDSIGVGANRASPSPPAPTPKPARVTPPPAAKPDKVQAAPRPRPIPVWVIPVLATGALTILGLVALLVKILAVVLVAALLVVGNTASGLASERTVPSMEASPPAPPLSDSQNDRQRQGESQPDFPEPAETGNARVPSGEDARRGSRSRQQSRVYHSDPAKQPHPATERKAVTDPASAGRRWLDDAASSNDAASNGNSDPGSLPHGARQPEPRHERLNGDLHLDLPSRTAPDTSHRYRTTPARARNADSQPWFPLLLYSFAGLCMALLYLKIKSLERQNRKQQPTRNHSPRDQSHLLPSSGKARTNSESAQAREPTYGWDDEKSSEQIQTASGPHAPASLVAPPGPWRWTSCSVTGNVRSRNEDAALAFELGGVQVLAVADGCGGVPHGQLASRLAVRHATHELFWQLANRTSDADQTIQSAVRVAAEALAIRGRELGIERVDGGLRTTLLIVMGLEKAYHWGYIGDGAIRVLRSDGSVDDVLQPQRSDNGSPNALSASLGPTVHGKPVFGCTERRPGDMLLSGSDGVFDRVDEQFPRQLLKLAINREGDLEAAVAETLRMLADAKDGAGCYICDDNLTLGVMMDGESPRLAPGFWKSSSGVRNRLSTRRRATC